MDILKRIVFLLWQLPQNLVALAMMPFMGKMKLVRDENSTWAFSCTKMSGAISLGNFIFLSTRASQKEATIRHEYGHVMDSHRFGPLYVFVIGIPSIMWAWLGDDSRCYYDFYTEVRANRNAGLKVGRNQYGCYIYIPDDK